MASGWMTVWRLDTGASDSKERDQMVETVQLGGDITKMKEIQIRRLEKRLTRLKEMWRRIISAVHVDRQRPICIVILCPLTKRNLSAKDVIGDKRKCAGRKRNFLKQ